MADKTASLIRILIVDDHPAVREALAARIGRQRDMEVCGEAADLIDALPQVALTQPDLAVVDISLKTGNGIDLIKRIKDRSNKVRILVWSSHSESIYAERALQAGALGYITKEEETDTIIEAIRRVLQGKIYLSDAMTEKMLHRRIGDGRKGPVRLPVDDLTDRELHVFQLIGEGVKTTEIAKRLHLSVKTIETYREHIRHKLDIKDGMELTRYATIWVLENRRTFEPE